MPVRNLLYDALDYAEQIRLLEQTHRNQKDLVNSGEYLSGIKKEDKIRPIITLVFYYGRREYINKENEAGKELLRYIPNYWINLVDGTKEEHLERYKSDLQYVLGMLKCNQNKKELYQYARRNQSRLKDMSEDAAMAMLAMLGEQERVMKLMDNTEEKGEIDMCQAIDELIEDGRMEGLREGKREGLREGKAAGLDYNVPIDVDTLRRRVP